MKHVLMTQSRMGSSLESKIKSHVDLEVCHIPFIKFIQNQIDTSELRKHVDALIFTSINGVKYSRHLLNEISYEYVIAIGHKTSEYCKSKHIHVDYISEDSTQEGIVELIRLINQDKMVIKSVLLPTSNRSRDVIEQCLNTQQITVQKIAVYDTVDNKQAYFKLEQFLSTNQSFTKYLMLSSPSAANHFVTLIYQLDKKYQDYIEQLTIVVIGAITYEAIMSELAKYDIQVKQVVISAQPTFESMVDRIVSE